MTPKLNIEDQEIEEYFLKLIDERRELKDRKDNARKVIELIINPLFDKNEGQKHYKHFRDTEDLEFKYLHNLSIRTKAITLKRIDKFSKSFVEGVQFIQNECSNNGIHMDNLVISQTGEPAYVDVVILTLRPIVEWYFYDYRKFKKSDLKIENELNKYYKNHFSFFIILNHFFGQLTKFYPKFPILH